MAKMKPTIMGPIFKEYLGYIEHDKFMVGEGSIGPLTDKDALLVIDMQNDFVSWHADHNTRSSRFASSETLDIIEPICELIDAFYNAGGVVVATKDYHPHDHCSFIGCTDVNFAPRRNQIFGMSAGFPHHCVQGSEGANIYSPIRDKLCNAMKKDNADGTTQGLSASEARANSRVQISFKGFNEAVDSFGGIEYAPDEDMGRFKDVYKKSPCQMSCWTGAVILKSSNMMNWMQGEIAPENVDAPPDIMAMQFGNRPMHIHEFIRNRGCKRVFVCGLVLDCCVIDTCINALKKGFETYMVIDATRPAFVQGFGAFGSGVALGLVNDPEPVKNWIESSKLPLVPTVGLISREAVERLKANKEVPFIDTKHCTERHAEVPQLFPAVWSVLLQSAERVSSRIDIKAPPTKDKTGTYSVARIQEIKSLVEYGFKLEGLLSPLSPVTLLDAAEQDKIMIPKGSACFAFAYPVDGADNIAKVRESSPQTMQCFSDSNLFFACFGGYVYFDAECRLVGCTGLNSGTVAQGARAMTPKSGWSDPDLVKKLHKSGRFRPAILPEVVAAGAKSVAWVLPGEGNDPSEFGGFVYVFYDLENPPASISSDLWFPF